MNDIVPTFFILNIISSLILSSFLHESLTMMTNLCCTAFVTCLCTLTRNHLEFQYYLSCHKLTEITWN